MTTKVTFQDDAATLTVEGRFSTDEAQGFLDAAESATSKKISSLVLELGALEFISSAGIRCFVMLLKTCAQKGISLKLRNLTPQLKDILTLTSLLDKFDVE